MIEKYFPKLMTEKPKFLWKLVNFPSNLDSHQVTALKNLKLTISECLSFFEKAYGKDFVVSLVSASNLKIDKIDLKIEIPIGASHLTISALESASKILTRSTSRLSRNLVNDLSLKQIEISSDISSLPDQVTYGQYSNGIDDLGLSTPKWKLENVVLPDYLNEAIIRTVSLAENYPLIYEKWGLMKIQPYPRILINLFGPPGTGKTMVAHGIADYLKKPILEITPAIVESKYVGEGPKNLHRSFLKASHEGAILFFDEADSFLSRRILNITQGSEQSSNSMRSQLLYELEHYSDIVIFATNLIESYDSGFNSRLIQLKFELPTTEERQKILEKLLLVLELPNPHTIDYSHLAELTDGLCGRDLRDTIIFAVSEMARLNETSSLMPYLIASIGNFKTSRTKLNG